MFETVERAIDKLRPAFVVNAVEPAGVEDGVVKVRVFSSACHAGIPEETVVTLIADRKRN